MIEWKRAKNNVKSFQLGDDPEFIHIIKTGFVDTYFVVHEDAYGICNDMEVQKYSLQELKDIFHIDILKD